MIGNAYAGSSQKSWWIGLSRTEFARVIRDREDLWRHQKPSFLDFIGLQIVGQREPRKTFVSRNDGH